MTEINISRNDLDFATNAAINLTLKRVKRELEELLPITSAGFSSKTTLYAALDRIANLTVEKIENDN
jgi:hypothetical protein